MEDMGCVKAEYVESEKGQRLNFKKAEKVDSKKKHEVFK